MKWNRFYNKHGGKGKNIPLDLRMEQLNKIIKTLWKGLGANLTESNAQRLAKILQSLGFRAAIILELLFLCQGRVSFH
jgi:hypothetical protein